jgi:hypothetical protein
MCSLYIPLSTFLDRLNESAPSASTSSKPVEVPNRLEPTEEAKMAGQVTLARIEAQKKNDSKFNT